MKTKNCLTLLLAAMLPLALSAQEGLVHHRPGDVPATVPDAASTLLLLGTGLGSLVFLKKLFSRWA